jgi:DNA-binding transcriptional regulator YdaS (Cro superfamily)
MCTEERFAEGIAVGGGLKNVAAQIGETVQAVWNWRGRGVPPNKCRAFSAATGIGLQELRPNDWADYWPELAEATP